jgi:hypothetical protein
METSITGYRSVDHERSVKRREQSESKPKTSLCPVHYRSASFWFLIFALFTFMNQYMSFARFIFAYFHHSQIAHHVQHIIYDSLAFHSRAIHRWIEHILEIDLILDHQCQASHDSEAVVTISFIDSQRKHTELLLVNNCHITSLERKENTQGMLEWWIILQWERQM